MTTPLRVLLPLILAAAATAAEARLYVWVNPDSGSVEMSGKPPTWYRGPEGGPRIQVFDNGNLVDDTAITLHPKHDQELREAAFEEFELRKKADALKRLERAARREMLRQSESERLAAAERARVTDASPRTGEGGGEVVPEDLDQDMVDRLKDIIRAWDSQNDGGATVTN